MVADSLSGSCDIISTKSTIFTTLMIFLSRVTPNRCLHGGPHGHGAILQPCRHMIWNRKSNCYRANHQSVTTGWTQSIKRLNFQMTSLQLCYPNYQIIILPNMLKYQRQMWCTPDPPRVAKMYWVGHIATNYWPDNDNRFLLELTDFAWSWPLS